MEINAGPLTTVGLPNTLTSINIDTEMVSMNILNCYWDILLFLHGGTTYMYISFLLHWPFKKCGTFTNGCIRKFRLLERMVTKIGSNIHRNEICMYYSKFSFARQCPTSFTSIMEIYINMVQCVRPLSINIDSGENRKKMEKIRHNFVRNSYGLSDFRNGHRR